MALQHLRSSTANKRPLPAGMSDGQLAINTNNTSPGLFFKDSAGALVKVGPVHVGSTAPNVSPAGGGQTGNTVGEQWLDTSGTNPVLKIWDGSAWQSEAGEFVNASGDTMTGALVMDNQQQVRFRETTANGTNYVAIQAPASVGADRTLTLPDVSGTIVSTGDTGTVTSTMIADGTIVNADVNASAAIAGTKVSPDFGSQTVTTTGVISAAAGAAGTPSIAFTGDLNTGIYSPGADQVAISTGGSQRLNIDANGRLNVAANSQGIRFGTQANISAAEGAELILNNLGAQPIAFYTNNSERLRITSAGLVGVGTSSPVAALDVNGRIAAIAGSSGTPTFHCNTDTNTGINLPESDRIQFVTGGVEAVRIDASQRVGIGTTPGLKLDIAATGDDGIRFSTTGTSNSARLELSSGSGTTSGKYSYIKVQNNDTNAQGYAFGTFGDDRWVIRDTKANSERLCVDTSGRLLVGTSTNAPSDTLFVVHGQPGNANEPAVAQLRRGGTILADYTLGQVSFADGSGNVAAHIRGVAETGWGGSGDAPGRLVFSVTRDGSASPTEALRIDNQGQLLTFFASGSNGMTARSASAAGTTYFLYRGMNSGTDNTTGGNNVFYVYTNGNVQNTNNSYAGISDIKLKENIVDAGSQWDDLKALQVRKYNFKEGQTHTQIGLVAQEVELVSPGLVSESPDRDNEGNDLGTVTKSVNYSVLYMKAVKALQEAMERIETLEAKVAALESA